MPKGTEGQRDKYAYTQNRELSWLRFNQRVLEEANDLTNPPIERLKFISIFSSNLDEFFMVRVGSLFDIKTVSPQEKDNKTGMDAEEQLARIYSTVPGLIELKSQIYASVSNELAKRDVCDLRMDELSGNEREYIAEYFKNCILPIISPIIVGNRHPVPHFVNKQLYIMALLKDKKGRHAVGVVPIPESLPPYVLLPGNSLRFIRSENIVYEYAPTLFGSYDMSEHCVMCVTRNASISFDDEKFDDSEEDFRERVTKLLKKRDRLSVLRMELSQRPSEEFFERLLSLTGVENRQVYIDPCPLNMKYVFRLEEDVKKQGGSALLYTPYTPRWPENISREHSMIDQIKAQDKLLFFPYDSMEPFLKLLSEAAERPDVISIKITIYRLASSSKISRILCRAAENGKEVLVVMELRARFDEANNVAWSKIMEEAGCQIVYGMEDFKCHSKMCLITMRNKGRLNYISQIGTGNYNEKTSTAYTDLSVMTADPDIGEDGTAFFRNMLINNLSGSYKKLRVAPNGIKREILAAIDGQIALGSKGYICIKANSVTEREVIDKLMEASHAGVEIQLIIRGICCILPGVPDYTENIHITSIVGRFLEHARIYCFGRGDAAKLYIASADLMTRNLNRRIEIACPIENHEIQDQLKWILDRQLEDTAKASFMMSDGVYSRKQSVLSESANSQQQMMETSIHSPVKFTPPRRSLFSRIKDMLLSEKY